MKKVTLIVILMFVWSVIFPCLALAAGRDAPSTIRCEKCGRYATFYDYYEFSDERELARYKHPDCDASYFGYLLARKTYWSGEWVQSGITMFTGNYMTDMVQEVAIDMFVDYLRLRYGNVAVPIETSPKTNK